MILTISIVTLRTMGETKAKVEKGIRSDHRHDWHTVSLLTDQLFFSPKYRGKVLEGKVAEAVEEIIKTGYITLYTKFFHAHTLGSTGYVTLK